MPMTGQRKQIPFIPKQHRLWPINISSYSAHRSLHFTRDDCINAEVKLQHAHETRTIIMDENEL